ADVDRHDFESASMMRVQRNVEDKKAFFTEIAGRLRPGGRLATFEVCRSGAEDPAVPAPRSIERNASFLATPADLLTTIEDSGFRTVEWVDETAWVLGWFEGLGDRLAAAGTAPRLPALLTDGPTRMLNFAGALADGVLTIHRGAFTLA